MKKLYNAFASFTFHLLSPTCLIHLKIHEHSYKSSIFKELISFITQTLESDNAQMKIENDHLRDLVANARDKGERDKEALKKATRYYFHFFIIL